LTCTVNERYATSCSFTMAGTTVVIAQSTTSGSKMFSKTAVMTAGVNIVLVRSLHLSSATPLAMYHSRISYPRRYRKTIGSPRGHSISACLMSATSTPRSKLSSPVGNTDAIIILGLGTQKKRTAAVCCRFCSTAMHVASPPHAARQLALALTAGSVAMAKMSTDCSYDAYVLKNGLSAAKSNVDGAACGSPVRSSS
jgi:hypothetical protein